MSLFLGRFLFGFLFGFSSPVGVVGVNKTGITNAAGGVTERLISKDWLKAPNPGIESPIPIISSSLGLVILVRTAKPPMPEKNFPV